MTHAISIRKPHNHLAGYIFERKHSQGWLVCYNAKEAGIHTEHKYVVCLERKENGSIGPSFTNLPDARAFVKLHLEEHISNYQWGL